jgi:hypothetical protein
MAQFNSGIGNVTTNTGLVEMAMAYSRSRMLCAAERLGVADALGDEVRSVIHDTTLFPGHTASSCVRPKLRNHKGSTSYVTQVLGLFCNASAKYTHLPPQQVRTGHPLTLYFNSALNS